MSWGYVEDNNTISRYYKYYYLKGTMDQCLPDNDKNIPKYI